MNCLFKRLVTRYCEHSAPCVYLYLFYVCIKIQIEDNNVLKPTTVTTILHILSIHENKFPSKQIIDKKIRTKTSATETENVRLTIYQISKVNQTGGTFRVTSIKIDILYCRLRDIYRAEGNKKANILIVCQCKGSMFRICITESYINFTGLWLFWLFYIYIISIYIPIRAMICR